MVRLGIEVLLSKEREILRGKRVGLVTNYSATDRSFRSTIDLLRQDEACQVIKLFGPEHGMLNCAKEGEHVSSEVDAHSGLPAYSLYGDTEKPTPEMLENIDLLVIDLVDIGARYYTNIATMGNCLEACSQLGVPCVVLDRPNPLNGITREGNILSPSFASLVGFLPIPNRHGLTFGELAVFYNSSVEKPCDLQVVRVEGWQRAMTWPETDLPFVSPTPNTTGFDMLLLYPGTCFIEGTNVSEGRGTTHPFEVIGAPFIDGHQVADRFAKAKLPGVAARPTYFVPTYQKHQGELCQGIQLHITNRQTIEPVRTGLILLQILKEMYPDDFAILPPNPNGSYSLDLLAGTDHLRHLVNKGRPLDYLENSRDALQSFQDTISQVYLY